MKTRRKYIWISIIVTIVLFFLISQFNNSSVKSTTTERITLSDISFNAFWADSTSCSNLREDKATMSISFSVNNKRINEACKLYVNNQDAGGPLYEDISKSNDYFLGMFEANKNHKVKVCCGDICKDVNVPKLCGEENSEIIPEVETPPEDSLSEICKMEPNTCGCPFTSNYENDKVAVICETCGNEEDFLLQNILEYQTEVYNCLINYFNYELDPEAKPIKYMILFKNEYADGEFINSFGSAGYCSIDGILRKGEAQKLKADVHETAHVFTNSLSKGAIPNWFNEGISIYADSRIQCHSKQAEGFHGMRDSAVQNLYLPLKDGDRSSFKNEAHYLGEMFNLALEIDYNCDINCFFEIVRDLRESCKEVENCDNKKIKSSAEKVTGQDLKEIFDLLELNY